MSKEYFGLVTYKGVEPFNPNFPYVFQIDKKDKVTFLNKDGTVEHSNYKADYVRAGGAAGGWGKFDKCPFRKNFRRDKKGLFSKNSLQ
jgi:hypothetical protein